MAEHRAVPQLVLQLFAYLDEGGLGHIDASLLEAKLEQTGNLDNFRGLLDHIHAAGYTTLTVDNFHQAAILSGMLSAEADQSSGTATPRSVAGSEMELDAEQIFDSVDLDGSGSIDVTELARAFHEMKGGGEFSNECVNQARALLQYLGLNPSDEISKQQFVHAASSDKLAVSESTPCPSIHPRVPQPRVVDVAPPPPAPRSPFFSHRHHRCVLPHAANPLRTIRRGSGGGAPGARGGV